MVIIFILFDKGVRIKKYKDLASHQAACSGYIVEFTNGSRLWINRETLLVGWIDNPQELQKGVVRFQKTKMNLFAFLLENAVRKEICRDELLYHVWEKYGLKSSSRQLWHAIGQLKLSLYKLGMPYDFIVSNKGKSYSLEKVKVFFITSSDINDDDF